MCMCYGENNHLSDQRIDDGSERAIRKLEVSIVVKGSGRTFARACTALHRPSHAGGCRDVSDDSD